ncbi:ABC transporter permease [Gulosibacter sp. 10]|uniref:ABC transporter permease n=1 Tax=Gulosibacter sp. 10 TaxID=1255570 RepID=UPI00097F20D4|nr:ABC transporter permease subunit [Gulosibacter sp. 10]SJM63969.1 Alkanesulfonates transport system permease protein [Gulosibacter sp. 10]
MTNSTDTAAPAPLAIPGSRVPPTDSTSEGRARIGAALARAIDPVRIKPAVVALGILSWIAVAAISAFVSDHPELPLRDAQYIAEANPASIVIALVVAVIWTGLWALSYSSTRVGAWAYSRVASGAAWLLGSGVFFVFWIFSTSKTLLLQPPYLIAPQEILERLWDTRLVLGESVVNSLVLVSTGIVLGVIAGLATGITIGWYQAANYWVHPILVFIGPVPALAWVPIVFVLSPSSFAGAVFMIALSVWFPISVLTRAGILSVPRSYFDVAQTLGAKSWFLVWKISLPAALPSIFTGAFMALGSAFATLVVAENFGVNSGLGWYLNWKKSFGDYPGLYAGIVVLIVLCGLALTLLFRIRNHVLRWEKGLTRW